MEQLTLAAEVDNYDEGQETVTLMTMYGGSGIEHLSGGGGMWSMILTGWTGEQQERIATVLSGLRKIGYTGDALFEQAKAIIWPKKSLSDLIGNAGDQEEAAFMATKTEGMKNFSLTAQLIEQAAKEVGDAYTNKLKVESTGKDGGPIKTETTNLTADQAAEIYRKMMG